MSQRCAADHPSLPIKCEAPARYPNHDHHFALHNAEPIEWQNPNYVAPPPKSKGRRGESAADKNIAVGMQKLAEAIKPKAVSVESLDEPHAYLRANPRSTEVAAADLSAVSNPGTRKEVLKVIAASMGMDPPGATDDMVAQVLADESRMTKNIVAARRGELEEAGWIEVLHRDGMDVERLTRTGSPAKVWVLTGSGKEMIAQVDFQ